MFRSNVSWCGIDACVGEFLITKTTENGNLSFESRGFIRDSKHYGFCFDETDNDLPAPLACGLAAAKNSED